VALAVDVFWSFRSPYSYLATPRLVALARDYDVDVRIRVVLPIAVRIEGFFDRVNPLWPPYLFRDTMRIAQFHEIPYAWPRPDPIVQDYATRQVAAEQPYIFRLTRLGVEAAQRGRGLPFVAEVSRVIWGGDVEGWHEGTHLADAPAARASTSRRWTRRSRRTRQVRRRHRGESARPRDGRSLGSTYDGLRERAVLRSGSHRSPRLAHAAARLEGARVMITRPLGRTGHRSSVLAFGGAAFWSDTDDGRATAALEDALSRGVNHVDVAPQYGEAERVLGPAIARHRERLFLACKTMERRATKAREELHRSLERLRTDRFDLYQCHAVSDAYDLDRLLGPGGGIEAIVEARMRVSSGRSGSPAITVVC
jgi:hypothetical protein